MTCSTPDGIEEELTTLDAEGRSFTQQCSTPDGIEEELTVVLKVVLWIKGVLNA